MPTQGFELSPQQKRLWLLAQTRQQYRVRGTIQLTGALHKARLQAAFAVLVRRHDILRTTFVLEEEGTLPWQQVQPDLTITWHENNISDLPPDRQQQVITALFASAAPNPFPTTAMCRPVLLQLQPEQHLLFVDLPAAWADARSLAVFTSQLADVYGQSAQEPAVEEKEFLPYAQIAGWLNEILAAAGPGEGAYWREPELADGLMMTLPVEQTPPTTAAASIEVHTATVKGSVAKALAQLCAGQALSPASFLLACWQLLLWRLGRWPYFTLALGSDDLGYEDLADIIGPLTRQVLIACRLEGRLAFRDLWQQVEDTSAFLLAQQEYFSWERVAAAQTPPYAAFAFSFHDHAPINIADSLSFFLYRQDVRLDRYHLKLAAIQQQTDFVLQFYYDTARFTPATITQMAQMFVALVADAVARPDNCVAGLSLLDSAAMKQLLHTFNATDRPYQLERCLHHWIEDQAARTPETAAVVFADRCLSYHELNERANQLAHYLRTLGVEPDQPVGICAQRSLELVVGLLGILKAGGAYVPLDPSYPAERLQFMLADTAVPILLSHTPVLDKLPQHQATVVLLDEDWPQIEQHDNSNPAVPVTPGHLAYIIYTSGSTGKPKGAMNSHQAICNRLLWMQEMYQLTPADRVLQKTPFSFDVSVWEFFWPLMTGARLVVAQPEGHRDNAYLSRTIQEYGITTIHFVPSMLRLFLEEPSTPNCHSLQRVICSGEALPPDLCNQFFTRLGAELHNLYGPTEAAVDVTQWPCGVDHHLTTVPIGQPIANIQIYILDAWLQPTPINIPGELYIGGAGVGRGYYRRPALTAEKFIPDPFSRHAGARLYKSGDLAYFRADGNIEFLGRIDHQVKIRGFRVELGEIETALRCQPGVTDAVVLLSQVSAHDQRLVAYLACATMPDIAAVRQALQDTLPDYMVPSAFVPVEAIPLSPNGKVDRRTLAALTQTGIEAIREPFAPPRTQIEEIVANVWQEVLSLARVGIHDNFFYLGGHSLLATQVIFRLRMIFGINLPVRSFFAAPTVAGLADLVAEMLQTATISHLPPIQRLSRQENMPLSFTQQGLWFLDQLDPENPAYNIPAAIRLRGELDHQALAQSFSELVSRHEILRTTFVEVDGQPIQCIHAPAAFNLLLVDLSDVLTSQREIQVEQITIVESRRPFVLSRGPLLRVTLLLLSAKESLLLLTLHHIVADGWSIGLIIRELTALYRHFTTGEPLNLPELPFQYADYAHWQRNWLRGELLDTELVYWKQRLGANLPVLQLPYDRPRPKTAIHHGGRHLVQIDAALTNALKRFGGEQGVTLFMTLMAAFQTLLYYYSRQEVMLVGTDMANRFPPATENLIGYFVNQVVLCADLVGNPVVSELLARTREQTLATHNLQYVPFDKVVEAVNPKRDIGLTPLFQAKLILQNVPTHPLHLPGLQLEPIMVYNQTAKFDLLLNMQETETGMVGLLDYNADLFTAVTIERMAAHYHTLLACFTQESDPSLHQLVAALADADRQWREQRASLSTNHQRSLSRIKRKAIQMARTKEDNEV